LDRLITKATTTTTTTRTSKATTTPSTKTSKARTTRPTTSSTRTIYMKMTDFDLNLQQDGWVEVGECYPPTATPVHTTGSHLSTQTSNASTKGNDCSLQEWFDPCGAGGLGEIIDTATSGPTKISATPDREQAVVRVAPSGPSKFFMAPPAFMVDLGKNGRKVERKTRGVPMI
jgi:hypothetical protein